MIQHVVDRARLVRNADEVLVAVDDQRVFDAVLEFGGKPVMTRSDHESGTDRLAEVLENHSADLIVNIQGDEPLLRPEDVELLIDGMLCSPEAAVGTLCHPLPRPEAGDPNSVKVVVGNQGRALYFSRAAIPFDRDGSGVVDYKKHIGIYAYRADVLRNFSSLPRPAMESAEKLEQLRLLANGVPIRVWEVAPTGPGVDTPESLEEVRSILAGEIAAGNFPPPR